MQPPPNYNAGPMQPPPSYNANSMPSLSSSFYSQPNTPIYNPENPQSGGSPPPAFFNYPSPENLPTPQGSPPNSPPQFPLSPQSPVSDLSIEMSPLKGDDREYTSPTNPPYAAPSPPPYIKTRTATSQVSPAENPEEDFDSDTFDNAVERGGPNEVSLSLKYYKLLFITELIFITEILCDVRFKVNAMIKSGMKKLHRDFELINLGLVCMVFIS